MIDNKIPQYRSYFKFDPTFETPDDHTLIWKSEAPTFAPEMPPWVYIVPEKVWEGVDGKGLQEIKAQPNTPSIASGPFVLTEWDQGQGWTMEKNPYFWGEEPTVDRIDFRVYSNQEAMTQALRNGEIDFADGIRPSLVNSVEGIDGVTVQKVISDWWLNLAFNFGGQGPDANPLPALQDLDVRTAIEMAIDKQAIADTVYQGHRHARRHDHPAGVGLLAPGHPGRRGVPVRSSRPPPTCSSRRATPTPTATGSARTRPPANRCG